MIDDVCLIQHKVIANTEGLTGKIRTVVGGAPVTEDYAREIGADAYAFDGISAVDRIRKLIADGGGLKDDSP